MTDAVEKDASQSKCTHDVTDMDVAAHSDGRCPLCLSDTIARLTKERDAMRGTLKNAHDYVSELDDTEAAGLALEIESALSSAGEGAGPSTLAVEETSTPSVSGRGQPAPDTPASGGGDAKLTAAKEPGDWTKEAANRCFAVINAIVASKGGSEPLNLTKVMSEIIAEEYARHASSAVAGWYRIDDPEHPAPKDGTEILGFIPGSRIGHLQEEPDIIDAVFWKSNTGGWRHRSDDHMHLIVTRWQPLPAPPKDPT